MHDLDIEGHSVKPEAARRGLVYRHQPKNVREASQAIDKTLSFAFRFSTQLTLFTGLSRTHERFQHNYARVSGRAGISSIKKLNKNK